MFCYYVRLYIVADPEKGSAFRAAWQDRGTCRELCRALQPNLVAVNLLRRPPVAYVSDYSTHTYPRQKVDLLRITSTCSIDCLFVCLGSEESRHSKPGCALREESVIPAPVFCGRRTPDRRDTATPANLIASTCRLFT
jgi:hypothetical protein